jgi:Uma2 family endonuclease
MARALAKSSLLSSESFPDQGDWTYEDYCRLPEDGWRYEVLRGKLHMTPAPSWPHQDAVWNFGFLLKAFVREKGLGKVAGAPADILLPGGLATPVQPDVFFISRERLGIIHDSHIEGAPDLILEVLSPSNWLTDRRDKFQIYAAAGVREYWIADPKNRDVEVFVLRDGTYELLGRFGPGERARSETLPGFEPAIDEIFES